ncbi:L-Fucosyltransferase [Caenorhabditis elegans]|uniref:L-Fucosyltransferase n=1 Tax=Caenorhabditis elegans TaxID=6239 RepID=O61922_CAEEL|nr:L-Fucosyltransferase [Caenorhabditis elegans]CCD65235.1 L-Fucosyltransferase [Caenorhabditis elegans]|eukprot:NP_504281.2 Uncharacterized protein CELE_C18G1.8 [Caenorhabditis elegans]
MLNFQPFILKSTYLAGYHRGNNIFEMASLLGISRVLNRTATFFVGNKDYLKMLNRVNETLPGLVDQFLIINGTVPPCARNTTFGTRCCVYEDPRVLANIDDQYLHITGIFLQSWKYFSNMKDELTGYLKKSGAKFGFLPKSDKNTHVNCVHVRKGDFQAVGFATADLKFVRSAIRFIEKKEKPKNLKQVAVLFGDNLEFLKSVINDYIFSNQTPHKKTNSTHFISQNMPADDLIYSKNHCDSVLISSPHSTFGWWIGYFSKGNKVYYMDIRETNDRVYRHGQLLPYDYFLPHWTPLKYASDNATVIESRK